MLHLFEWQLLSLFFMLGALSDERTGSISSYIAIDGLSASAGPPMGLITRF
jgi:hypothetical protein